MKFSVMTFNVRGAYHNDGINSWDQRRTLNIDTILDAAPDIIGFQEAQRGNIVDYEISLRMYERELGPISIRQAETYHHVPIYWLRHRFQKLASGGFYLSETPEIWSKSWGSGLERAVTWVKLQDCETKQVFVVLNTHFPHEPTSDIARIESARLIIRQLATIASDLPCIVMADFNTIPGSEPYLVFHREGYLDTHIVVGQKEGVNTFHGFLGDGFPRKGARIDWILTKNNTASVEWRVHSSTVITTAKPPFYPSDHTPVVAEVELTSTL